MPQIIAHRGASRERLENTLAAFERALELGADAVELDVHRTVDGTVVVHHDPVLKTAPADALAGRAIASLTTAELASFRLADGQALPTLEEVARLIGDRATLYCELKGPGTAAPSVEVLRTHRAGPSAVHSFDHRMVADAARCAPDIPRGVLEVSRHLESTAILRSVGARDLWQLVEYIDEALVREVHAAGGRVIAWTANAPDVIERLATWNVDGLCTDDVPTARRVLGR